MLTINKECSIGWEYIIETKQNCWPHGIFVVLSKTHSRQTKQTNIYLVVSVSEENKSC